MAEALRRQTVGKFEDRNCERIVVLEAEAVVLKSVFMMRGNGMGLFKPGLDVLW